MNDTKTKVMIKAENLSRFYGDFRAVENISFEISQGEIVAFLGPNGAGKSTTMKLLSGFVAPSEGQAFIGGFNIDKERIQAAKILGYLPENGPLYLDMTPREALGFICEIRNICGEEKKKSIEKYIKICDLEEVFDKPIGKLSKGFRQRVGMAQVLLHNPQVIIMDEPTSGLDPNQIKTVRQTIKELGKNKTILLSTHILQEVEAVADRVLFINEGRLVFDGTVEKFKSNGKNLDEIFYSLSAKKTAKQQVETT